MTLPAEILEGKYQVVRKISEGGMGAIYKVRHLLLDEDRVIKVIRPQYADDAELRERFTREARTAIRLRHPKIAELFDFAVGTDGTAYIVMEFIDGKTLKDVLRDSGPPALDLTLEIAVQTLEALGFLHRKGYLHRDIAPDNAMLTRDHEGQPLVKLIDLGIAKRLEGSEGPNLTSTGMFVGKARYSSPEQFAQKEMDQRSDLYSFGVMFYELLTGAAPIEGTNLSQLIAGHLFKPPRDFSETDLEKRVPADVRRVVVRSLAKEPDQRMASAEEYVELLRPCLEKLGPADPDEVEATILVRSAVVERPDKDTTTSISAARSLVGQNKFEEAEVELRHVLEREPANTEALRMLAMVEEVLRHKAEAERQGAITRRADQIQQLLEQGELDAAGEQLADAVTEFGEAELFRDLHRRLEDAMAEREQAKRLEKARGLLSDAERRLESGDLTGSREILEEVRGLGASDAGIDGALAQVAENAERLAAERARIEEERRQAEKRRQRAASLVTKARRFVDGDDVVNARRLLLQALEHDAGNQDAKSLLAQAEAAIREKEDEAKRQKEIAAAAGAVRAHLAQGELTEAETALGAARSQLGESEVWQRLKAEVEAAIEEEAEKRRREQTRQQTLAGIEDELARGELTSADASLAAARSRFGDDADLQRLEARLEELRAAEAAEREREKARRDAVAQVERLLEKDLAAAAEALEQAIREFGEHTDFHALAERLRDRRSEERVRSLLEAARDLQRKNDLDEAFGHVEMALGIQPENPEAQELRSEIEAQVREGKVAEAAERIESCLAGEELGAAREILTTAESQLGSHPSFQGLRQRIDQLEQKRRQRQVRELLASAGRRYESGEPEAALADLSQARSLDPDNGEVLSWIARIDAELEAQRTYAATVVEVGTLLDKGKIARADTELTKAETSYSDTAELRTLRERLETERIVAQQSKKTRNKVIAVVAAVVVVILVGAAMLSRRSSTPTPVTSSVIVNAVPWGRLVDVVDHEGNPQAADQAGASTPIVLKLPPGNYTIRLENENFEGPVSLEVELEAGRDERLPPAKFDDVQAEEFFDDLGW